MSASLHESFTLRGVTMRYAGDQAPALDNVNLELKVGESVALHWQQQRAQLRKDQAGRGLRVQFRLYPGGFAQLVQIERSSGDPNVDEAGMRTEPPPSLP